MQIQEQGEFVSDLQCTGGLENACSWFLSLVEITRKRLRQVPSLEDTSNPCFDLTLLPLFCKLCSGSMLDLQP